MCLAGWRAAADELAARKLARCFYCWRWYCQVRLLREVAFQNKQRAIREALAIGEQVARRRKAALLASSFMAWHVQVRFRLPAVTCCHQHCHACCSTNHVLFGYVAKEGYKHLF